MTDKTIFNSVTDALGVATTDELTARSLAFSNEILTPIIQGTIPKSVATTAVTAVAIGLSGQFIARLPEGGRAAAKEAIVAAFSEGIDKALTHFARLETLIAQLEAALAVQDDPTAEIRVRQAALDGEPCPGCGEIHELTPTERAEFEIEVIKLKQQLN